MQKDHSGSRALYSALYKFCYPSSSSKLSSDAYARYTSPSIASSAPSSPRSANFPGMSSAGSSNYFAASPSPSRMDFGFDNLYYTSYSSSTHPLEQLDANHWDLTGFGGVGSGSGYSPGSEFSSNGTGEDYFGSASMVAGSASVHPGLFPPFVSGAGTEEYDFDGHSLSSGSRSNSLSPTSACFTFVSHRHSISVDSIFVYLDMIILYCYDFLRFSNRDIYPIYASFSDTASSRILRMDMILSDFNTLARPLQSTHHNELTERLSRRHPLHWHIYYCLRVSTILSNI